VSEPARRSPGSLAAPVTDQATQCATFTDEWARAGLTEAVIAPGSRSTPLALALTADPRFRVQVFHDERAASFAALGCGLATGRPAVLLCTSGTAAAHFHAAVIEAHQAGVPLLVCTADRPSELQQVGAPQTVDQVGMYGRAVRWAVEVGVADAEARDSWRSLAARSVAEATGARGRPGPVHLNVAFRDPLVGAPGELPAGRPGGMPWHALVAGTQAGAGDRPAPQVVEAVAARCTGRPGVVVAGGGCGPADLVSIAARALGWPVLADPRSGVRDGVAHWDGLLRVPELTDAYRPEVVLRLGAPPASKVLTQWLAGCGAEQIAVFRPGEWFDPERLADEAVVADPAGLLAALVDRLAGAGGNVTAGDAEHREGGWLDGWHEAGARAGRAIEATLAAWDEVTEPLVARSVTAAVPPDGQLVVASSMPIRDVEWFAGVPQAAVRVHANRGANGIDGTLSTAVGIAAATGQPTVVLLGDVAFLHDSTALIGLERRGLPLTMVVIDNDGGGIFSFLPQATSLATDRFEQLFGTPHGVRPEQLAAVHGIASLTVEDPALLEPALSSAVASGRTWLVVARTDRARNVEVHRLLNEAIAAAVRYP
jgi:2-succinyl-5-enolpyruvyl-6-hydroxy-3-cyclohexene-1-carboxylate synthase